MDWESAAATSRDALAERMRRQYGRRLLDLLPHLPPDSRFTSELVDGYRTATAAMVQTARRLQRTDARLQTTRLVMLREARVARAVFDVLHRHLVALQLADLYRYCDSRDGGLDLVLDAERQVLEIAGDIGDLP